VCIIGLNYFYSFKVFSSYSGIPTVARIFACIYGIPFSLGTFICLRLPTFPTLQGLFSLGSFLGSHRNYSALRFLLALFTLSLGVSACYIGVIKLFSLLNILGS